MTVQIRLFPLLTPIFCAYLEAINNSIRTLKLNFSRNLTGINFAIVFLFVLATPVFALNAVNLPKDIEVNSRELFINNSESSVDCKNGIIKGLENTNSFLHEGDVNVYSDSKQHLAINQLSILANSTLGDSCSNPIDITENAKINGWYKFNVDNTSGSQFYSYTASEYGYFRMHSCLNPGGVVHNTSMSVYKNNCGNLEWEGDDNCHGMTTYDGEMHEGETYIFKWDSEEQDIFEARFYFYQPVTGINCDDAVPIVEGLNTVNYYLGSQYFSYIAATPGTIHVSTCGLMNNIWDIYNTTLYESCDAPAPVKVSSECYDIYEDVQMELTYHVDVEGSSYILELKEVGHIYWDYDFEFSFTPDCVDDEVTLDTTVCGSYDFNGNTLVSSGTYFDTFTNHEGCDSSVTLNLIVNQAYSIEETISICPGESYTLPSGGAVYTDGTYTSSFLTKLGCDSIITTKLTVNQNYDIEENISICPGESYTLPSGEVVHTDGTYTSSFLTELGCDSIITTKLTVNQNYDIEENVSICQGETFTLPDGREVSTEGTYTNSLLTKAGCDSIITINLSVNQSYLLEENVSICQGETYALPNGSEAGIAGTYTNSLLTKTGCDSIIITNISVNEKYAITEEVEVCSGDGYVYPDGTTETNISANTSHVSSLTLVSGCDSTITTNITVNSVDVSVVVDGSILSANETSADSYEWFNCELNVPVNGEIYSTFTAIESGNYAVIIEDNGCVDTSACNSVIKTGINDVESLVQVIWPNPTSDKVNIKLDENDKVTGIFILDTSGRILFQNIVVPGKTKYTIELPTENGMYFIRTVSLVETSTYKVIKQ